MIYNQKIIKKGLLQIYNYLTKELIAQRLFEYEEEKKDDKDKGISLLIKKKVLVKKINKIESIAYSTKGTWIGNSYYFFHFFNILKNIILLKTIY